MIVLASLSAAVVLGIAVLHYRDRDKQRVHDNKVSLEVLAVAKELNVNIGHLQRTVEAVFSTLHTEQTKNLDNYKNTLVAVLKDMREIVKNTESERQRTAGVAAATLLRPGKRMPQP